MKFEKANHAADRSFGSELGECLAKALRTRGWRVSRPVSGNADLLAVKGPRKYLIELKVGREPRREILQALLADSILRARRAASNVRGAHPLAVVGAPHISNATAAALKAYAAEMAPGEAFGLVDQRGLIELFGPGLDDVGERPRLRGDDPSTRQRSRALFSDLNQWALKVLLGQKIAPDLMAVPRAALESPSALAKLARVSVASAWRLVTQLEAEGFLERGVHGLEIVRTSELLTRWRAASSASPSQQVALAWALPSENAYDQLKKALARDGEPPRSRACLGLFSACELLGVSFVSGAPVHMYVTKYDPALLERLGLVLAREGGRVDAYARIPRAKESVFRGAISRDGVMATDVLQCWLDVSAEPTRGQEQADYLWRRVLAPQLQLEETLP